MFIADLKDSEAFLLHIQTQHAKVDTEGNIGLHEFHQFLCRYAGREVNLDDETCNIFDALAASLKLLSPGWFLVL